MEAASNGNQPEVAGLVIDIPVMLSLPGLSKARSVLVPVLFTELDGTFLCPREVVSFSISLVRTKADGYARKAVVSIGRLYEFWWKEGSPPLLEASVVDTLFYTYLAERMATPDDVNLRKFPNWQPITWETFRQEHDHLRQYAHFCRKQKGTLSAMGLALQKGSMLFVEEAVPRVLNDRFLSHLNVALSKWRELQDFKAAIPSEIRHVARRRLRRGSKRSATPSFQDIIELIEQEKNLTFKALWIILFGTGARISEVLNMWVCDVLPGAYAKYFSDIQDMWEPFIIFAHPELSIYTGSTDMARARYSRATVLNQKYGLYPRTELNGTSERAGVRRRMI